MGKIYFFIWKYYLIWIQLIFGIICKLLKTVCKGIYVLFIKKGKTCFMIKQVSFDNFANGV